MLQMFKPMAGGTRVLVNVSGCMVSPCDDMLVEAVLTNSSTPCSATATAGKSLLVAVLNQGTAAQSIALASGGVTAGWQCVSATGTVLDETSMRPIPSVPLPGAGSFESPPRSLTVIKYQYCAAATTEASVARVEREGPTSVAPLAPAAELLREELFCDAFMQQVGVHTRASVSRKLGGGGLTVLRIRAGVCPHRSRRQRQAPRHASCRAPSRCRQLRVMPHPFHGGYVQHSRGSATLARGLPPCTTLTGACAAKGRRRSCLSACQARTQTWPSGAHRPSLSSASAQRRCLSPQVLPGMTSSGARRLQQAPLPPVMARRQAQRRAGSRL